jgi:hypothetical protein
VRTGFPPIFRHNTKQADKGEANSNAPVAKTTSKTRFKGSKESTKTQWETE